MDLLVRPISPPRPASDQLVFREITRAQELLPLLRLRHLVYSNQGYWDSHSRRVDLDAYDRHSRFVGAYIPLETGALELIGGARFIQAEGEPGADSVDQIVRSESLQPPRPRQHEFTAQELMDFSPALQQAEAQGCQIVEFGRTVVHPDWQKSGLGQQLVCALYGLALNCNIGLGLALVPPRLLRFYGRCGCRPMQGGTSTYYSHTELVPVVVDMRDLGECSQPTAAASHALALVGEWGVWMDPGGLRAPAGVLALSSR